MNEKLEIIITAKIDKFKQNIEAAQKEIKSFKDRLNNASKDMDKKFNSLGKGIGKAIKKGCKVAAAAITSVTTAVTGFVTASVKGYADYEQLVGGVEKLFDSGYDTLEDYTKSISKSTDSIKAFQQANGLAVDGIIGPKTQAAIEASFNNLSNVSETVIKNAQKAYKTAGISANTYMEQVTSFSASLISSLGGDTAKAAQYADMAIQDMADNVNVFGSNMEDVQNAYQGFAKQNYTMLDNLKLGYGGTKEEMERLIEDANRLKEAQGEVGDLTIESYADVVEAIHLVQDEMGITGTTAKEAESTISGSIAMTKAAWSNLMTGLADSNADIPALVEGVISSAISVLENIIPVVKQVLENIPTAISEISPEAGAAFQTVVDVIMAILPTLQEALQTTFDLIVSAINFISENTGVIIGVATAIGLVVAAIGLYNTVAAVKAAMDAAQVTTLAGLITAQAAQAAATIAAIAPYIALAAGIAIVIAIIVLCIKNWDWLKETVQKVATAIKEWVLDMVNSVVGWFGEMKDKVASKIEELKSNVTEKFNNIKTAISEKVTAAKEKVVEVFTGIKDGIKEKINSAKSTITSVFTSIKTTITDKITAAKTSVLDLFDKIKSGIKEKIDGAKQGVSDAIDKIKGFFNFDWSLPKLKMPHFSITGSFSLYPPSVPKFGVEWYKLGGVFDSKTLFNYGSHSIGGLGEDGAEAIVPLEKIRSGLIELLRDLAAVILAQSFYRSTARR